MVQVYISTNTNYDKNGDMSLTPIRCEVKGLGINKPIELELEHKLDDLGRYKYLEKGNVIRNYIPSDKKKGQLFRIYDLDKDSVNGSITVYAIQLFYDNLTTYVKDLKNEDVLICDTGNVDGEKALNKILSNTPYTGFSDIKTTMRSRLERKNIVAAITGTDENSFVNRWGGELFIDNFNVYMNRKIGRVSGITISYGRNQKSIKETSSTKNTVTRIIPIGFNGLRLEGKAPWVDSPNINKYPTIMEREIKFDHVKFKSPDSVEGFDTKEEARLELIRLSKELFKEGIDSPEVTIKTEIEDLSKTVEYKKYACLEEIQLGDYIKAIHSKFNIDTMIRCEGYVWNVLTEQYISITLGNSIHNFFDKQTEGLNKINDILNNDGTVNAVAVEGILNAVNVQMKAMRDIAQNVPVRAMICEDLVPDSPTFGAMCYGTMGFMISDKRLPDDSDWDFRTFGTGKGFFADLIVAGTMLADRIRGGVLESIDGSLKMDLTDTKNGIQFMKNGLKAISINGNQLDFFDWDGLGESIAKIYSTRFGSDELKTGLAIANKRGSAISVAYEYEDGKFKNYITFDKDDILHEEAIKVLEDIIFSKVVSLNDNVNIKNKATLNIAELFGTKDGRVGLNKCDSLTISDENNNSYFSIANGNIYFAKNGKAYFYKDAEVERLNFDMDVLFNKNIHVNGNINCSGTINGKAVHTDTAETQKPIQTLFQKAKTILETTWNEIKIYMPGNLKGESNTDYFVRIEEKEGPGDIWISEKTEDYFIVKSQYPIKFTYKIESTLKYYENDIKTYNNKGSD